MNMRMLWRTAVVAAMTWGLSGPAVAQAQPQVRVDGEIHDFTGEMTPADPLGPWQVDGEWSITLNTASGKVDVAAALTMTRSDNVTRAAHTHHVELTDAQITPIANGYRLSGNASIAVNGAPAGFTGSPIELDITGGSAVPFATVKLTFGGAAVAHFSDATLTGMVNLAK